MNLNAIGVVVVDLSFLMHELSSFFVNIVLSRWTYFDQLNNITDKLLRLSNAFF